MLRYRVRSCAALYANSSSCRLGFFFPAIAEFDPEDEEGARTCSLGTGYWLGCVGNFGFVGCMGNDIESIVITPSEREAPAPAGPAMLLLRELLL